MGIPTLTFHLPTCGRSVSGGPRRCLSLQVWAHTSGFRASLTQSPGFPLRPSSASLYESRGAALTTQPAALNDPIMSSQPFEERNRLLWFGAHRVVGVGFRVPDDAIAVDHKTCGHRQLPGSIPITLLKIVLEGIDVEILQIAWQCKNQTECVGYLQA